MTTLPARIKAEEINEGVNGTNAESKAIGKGEGVNEGVNEGVTLEKNLCGIFCKSWS